MPLRSDAIWDYSDKRSFPILKQAISQAVFYVVVSQRITD